MFSAPILSLSSSGTVHNVRSFILLQRCEINQRLIPLDLQYWKITYARSLFWQPGTRFSSYCRTVAILFRFFQTWKAHQYSGSPPNLVLHGNWA